LNATRPPPGVRRLFSETLETNEKVLSIALKAGFVIVETADAEGVMQNHKNRCAILEFVVDDGVGRS